MMDNLARLALIGTSRQPNAAIRTDLPIDPLLESLTPESAERRVLLAAGAAAVYRSAGQLAPSAPGERPVAAAPDQRPPCSAKAAALLADLVRGKQVDLAAEAAELLDQAGQRAPHDILPVLLEVADPYLRKMLRPVLDERGRWLASFNPGWLWAVGRADELPASPGDLETVWNEGALAARVAVLTRLHEVQPERARDRLSQVWAQEKAEPRAELLAAFSASLTPDDEPFIESILDDRSMVVRTQAARLLARIPGSRLSQRMIARADAMLAYEAPKGGMLSKLKALAGGGAGKLLVEPPQEIDAAWERDGIGDKAPPGMGKRAYWLRQVLSMVPFAHWQQRFGVAPDVLLSAARATEWWETILAAWTDAARAFADAGWRTALWDSWFDLITVDRDLSAGIQQKALAMGVPAMLAAMPSRDSEACLLAAFKSSLPIGHVILFQCLRDLGRPWTIGLARQCLARLRQEAAAATAQRSAAVSLLAIAARAIPPDCFAEALAPWTQSAGANPVGNAWAREIAGFIEIVQLRKTLREETRS
jgi:hypothetical protein